jgi:hypothetical protein
MNRWSSTIISFIPWFRIFIDDNDNDDDDDADENENDNKNDCKWEFPYGRTLTLHYSLASKSKRERKEGNIQLANFNITRKFFIHHYSAWLNNHIGISISSFKLYILGILKDFIFLTLLRLSTKLNRQYSLSCLAWMRLLLALRRTIYRRIDR